MKIVPIHQRKKYKSAYKKASVAAAAIHKGKRKAKDFTK